MYVINNYSHWVIKELNTYFANYKDEVRHYSFINCNIIEIYKTKRKSCFTQEPDA